MIDSNSIFWTLMVLVSLMVIIGLSAPSVLASNDISGDFQTINIDIKDNGNAEWTIELRQEFNNQNDRENFESWINEFNTNQDSIENDNKERFASIIDIASSETDRDMNIDNFRMSVEIEESLTNEFGVTKIQFTWVGFSDVNNGKLYVGDVFHEGYTIGSEERLTISWGENIGLENANYSIQPEHQTNNSIIWSGPSTFGEDEPSLTFVTNKDAGGEVDERDNTSIIGAVLIILIFVGGLVIYYVRKPRNENSKNEEDSSESSIQDNSSNKLKTDEEIIVEYIKDNDGRIKQKSIKEAFDWSDSKISRVTKKLEDEEVIEKLRLGRENVLKLNDEQS